MDNDMNDAWAELAHQATGRFEPTPIYDPECDTLTLFISDELSELQRIDRYLTLYRSLRTGEVTGCMVWNVRSRLMATVRDFNLGIEADSITLGLLLLAVPLADVAPDDWAGRPPGQVYRELIEPLSHVAGHIRIGVGS